MNKKPVCLCVAVTIKKKTLSLSNTSHVCEWSYIHTYIFTRSTLWGRICLSRDNCFRGKFCGEGAVFRGALAIGKLPPHHKISLENNWPYSSKFFPKEYCE